MVVAVGLTVAQSFAFRLLPTPGVIEMAVAPVTCQHSLVELPASMVVGVATNTTTCGTVPVATVIGDRGGYGLAVGWMVADSV